MTTLKTNVSGKATQGDPPEAGSHIQMHREHREWLNDIKTWQDDMVQWQSETRKLTGELKELESILDAHNRGLVSQSEAIFKHHQMLAKHEHALSQFERGGPGDELIACSCAHHEEAEKHAQQKICHETAKQGHRTLVSQWQHLQKAISKLPKT